MFNYYRTRIILLLCLQSIVISVCAQYPEDNGIRFGVNDGLPSSTCYDLVQDARGFLWISSEGGLTRYDGTNFKNYNTSDGLVDNEVISLEQDKSGRIWMNTNGPLSFIQEDSVRILSSENNSVLNYTFKVAEEGNYLYVNRIRRLFAFNSQTLESVEIELPPNRNISDIKLAGSFDGGVWAVKDNVLYKYIGQKITQSYELEGLSELKVNHLSFYSIQGSALYYAEKTILRKFDLETHEQEIVAEMDDNIRKVVLKDDALWVLTQKSLNVMTIDEDGEVIESKKLLDGSLCSKFLFDDNDNLWAAGYKNGLMMIPQDKENIIHTPLNTVGSNNLESIVTDGDSIVLGSEKGFLYVVNQGNVERYNSQDGTGTAVNRIIDIIPIPGRGYLLSKDSGLYHFENGKFRKLLKSVVKNLFLKDDMLLINTYDRLYETEVSSLIDTEGTIGLAAKENFRMVQKGRSYSSLICQDGKIWNASVLGGLNVISEKDTFSFKHQSSIFNCTISRLFELDNGVICAVTKGEGLILIKDKTFKQINDKNGLSSNFCYDVDSYENQIFVASNKGVSIIELIDFERLDFKVKTVDMHDGLLSNEVQDLAYKDNTLYLATNKGLLSYMLSDEDVKTEQREVFIEDFAVNDVSRTLSDNYVLNAFDNNLRINLISPNIGSKRNNMFAFKLKGVDEDWIRTTSGETHYRNLESGKYEFMYSLSSNSKDNDVKSIMIEVEPRLIQSNSFKLMILAALGCLFMVPLYFNYSSQKRNLLANLLVKKSDEVNEKMKLLEKSNKRLVASNKELEQFAYIASHDLQEPINTIKGFTDILTHKFEASNDDEIMKMLSLISNSSSRMKDLVKDLLVFSRIGKDRKKSMVDMNSLMGDITKDLTDRIESNNAKITWDNLQYIPGYEVELRSLIQNLLSNGIKFQRPDTPPKIHVSSTKTDTGVEFSVKDNGIGIGDDYRDRIFEIFQRLHNKDEYEGTGIGLAHCKKIVNLHHGRIWVESVPSGGSNFKFTIEV